jgi:hypothetical protein
MRIYVQSKSGDYNVAFDGDYKSPYHAFINIRKDGAYSCLKNGHELVIPFEEIEYIREATENDFE